MTPVQAIATLRGEIALLAAAAAQESIDTRRALRRGRGGGSSGGTLEEFDKLARALQMPALAALLVIEQALELGLKELEKQHGHD